MWRSARMEVAIHLNSIGRCALAGAADGMFIKTSSQIHWEAPHNTWLSYSSCWWVDMHGQQYCSYNFRQMDNQSTELQSGIWSQMWVVGVAGLNAWVNVPGNQRQLIRLSLGQKMHVALMIASWAYMLDSHDRLGGRAWLNAQLNVGCAECIPPHAQTAQAWN